MRYIQDLLYFSPKPCKKPIFVTFLVTFLTHLSVRLINETSFALDSVSVVHVIFDGVHLERVPN